MAPSVSSKRTSAAGSTSTTTPTPSDPASSTISKPPLTRSTAFSSTMIPPHRRAPTITTNNTSAGSSAHAPNPKRMISLPASASAFGLAAVVVGGKRKPVGLVKRSAGAADRDRRISADSTTGAGMKLSSTVDDFGLSVPDKSHANNVRITRATAARLNASASPAAASRPSANASGAIGTTSRRTSSTGSTAGKHARFSSPPRLHEWTLPTAFGRRSSSHDSSPPHTRSRHHATLSSAKPKMTIDPAFATDSPTGSTFSSGMSGSGSGSGNNRDPNAESIFNDSDEFEDDEDRAKRRRAFRANPPTFGPTPSSQPGRILPPRYVPQYPLPPQPYCTEAELEWMDFKWSSKDKEAWEDEIEQWKWKKFWDHEKGRVAKAVAQGQDVGYGPGRGGWDELGRKTIDLVFCLDATGSMGSYLRSATENIHMIVRQIAEHENLEREDDLRIAVVAYRDLPEQCSTYITKECHFTSDIDALHSFIGSLSASGGGDGPECTASALNSAYERLQWRENSAKCCILVTDAPPHGIGESGDYYPDGEPDRYGGYDPLVTARQFAQRGIPIFVVACEPGLSSYKNGVELYQAICTITSGMMLPLKTADLLAKAVIGAVLEHVEIEQLVRQIGAEVAAKIQDEGSVDSVIAELHRSLQLRGNVTKQVRVDNVYNETASYKHNVDAWTKAMTLSEGKANLIPWDNRNDRFTEACRSSYGGGARYYHPLPPRSTPSRSESPASVISEKAGSGTRKSPKIAIEEDEDEDDMGMSDSDSEVEVKRRSKTSPIKSTDTFAAFKAKPGAFGTLAKDGKIGSPPGMSAKTMAAKPTFRGMRPAKPASKGMDDDDSDAEEDERNLPLAPEDAAEAGADTLGFGMAAISLDQAKRIANQSIWRMRG